MMKILNLIKPLEKGTVLYSSLLGDVKLQNVSENNIIVSKDNMDFAFNELGQIVNYYGITSPECLLFKEKVGNHGKPWEEVLKSTLKNGDFLIKRSDSMYYNSESEYDYIYIKDIDNEKIYHYGPSHLDKLDDIDGDYMLLRDLTPEEAQEFYEYIFKEELTDNPYGDELFKSVINELTEYHPVKLDKIEYDGSGRFEVTMIYGGTPSTHYIDFNNRV